MVNGRSLDVVMPVMNQAKYTREILDYFHENTIKPDSIIVIDNGSTDETSEVLEHAKGFLPITVLHQPENIGVNASWNLGLKYSEADIVSVLNNDLVLPPFFFEKIYEAFEILPDCGYVIPITMKDRAETDNAQNRKLEYKEQGMREGWAFSMSRIAFVRQGPIPSGKEPNKVYTFFGDDYFYWMVRRCGLKGYKLTSVPIYHYLSRTLYHSGGAQEEWGPDYQKWEKQIMPEIPKRKRDWEQVPHNENLSPYSMFYIDTFMQACKSVSSGETRYAVEFESPFGCSTRMFRHAMAARENYEIKLFGRETNEHVESILDENIEFLGGFQQAKLEAIEDESLMLVHIDVDPHDYVHTSFLFEVFRHKLRKGGYFLFHDCSSHFGVHKFVSEALDTSDRWKVEFCSSHDACPIASPARAQKV